jgi:hypothetical protein
MNIVICTDLNKNFIYGVFLEVLYLLEKKQPGKNIACIIVGDRDKARIGKIEKLIQDKIKIDSQKIHSYCCTEAIDKMNNKKIKKFSEEAANNVSCINDISKLEYMGYQVGIPVLSSLIQREKCVNLDIENLRKILSSYIYYSLATYFSFLKAKELFDHESCCQYYVYNGRTYNTYPITVLAPEESMNYYERFDYHKKLRIQRCRIHDFVKTSNLVKEFWENSKKSMSEKENIGKRFFEENQSNIHTKRFSNDGLNISSSEKKIITYFINSSDEFASVHPNLKVNTIFESQESALEFLADWVKRNKNYKLVLRVHPNYENKCKIDRDLWNKINMEDVEVIGSSSSINSYELIKKSHLVVSYRSTAAIEATYLGIPSIVLSTNWYSGVDAVYVPQSRKELNELLANALTPKPLKNCLKYGFFMKEFGRNFDFLSSQNMSSFEEMEKNFEE